MIKRQDVWIVNAWEAIQWMQQPTVQASVRKDYFLLVGTIHK